VRRPRGEGGSIAVELVFLMPLFLLLLALLYGYGRVAQVNGTMEAGTRDAARSASQARSAAEAEQAAERAVLSSLGAAGAACRDTLEVRLRDGVFRAGFPVTVEATCTYPLGDLGLPGVPGTVQVSSSFTSPVDPNRGVR
jgi:Flp pilus assembly protein TadG